MLRPARAATASALAAVLLGVQAESPVPAAVGTLDPAGPVQAEIASAPGAAAQEHLPRPTDELAAPEPKPLPPFALLGAEVAPGEKRLLHLPIADEVGGRGAPVGVVHGGRPGPVLCVAAGIHGDELNGVEITRNLLQAAAPAALRGTLIAMPIINLYGFRHGSRYLADRRDLNRFFPGRARGSLASRIAHAVFEGVVRRCSALIDLHSGSFHRTNIPQVRADLSDPATQDLALAFGPSIVVHNPGLQGTLRRTAAERGIPAITYEAGEPMRFQRDEIERGLQGLERVLVHIGMLETAAELALAVGSVPAASGAEGGESDAAAELYWSSRWVRVDSGGILLAQVGLGDRVEEGDLLGTVTDPLSNHSSPVYAPRAGRVIGMALDQIVVPGFAAFHVASPDRPGEGEVDELEPKDLDTPPVELGPDAGEEE